MISRLEDKASPDATHNAHCDKELSESRAKKEAKLAELENLSSSIDTKTAKSAQLKREVGELQTSLGELAASQVAVTKLRAEEKDAFATNERNLEDGIEGVRSAWESYVTTTEEPTQRTQLQVRAEESLDCSR